MGHTDVGWVMKGWDGSWWGGSWWGGMGHGGVVWGWDGSCRGGMGWVMKNIKILKILNYWCYRVSNAANQNQICRVLNFLNHDKQEIKLSSEFLCNSHSTFYE